MIVFHLMSLVNISNELTASISSVPSATTTKAFAMFADSELECLMNGAKLNANCRLFWDTLGTRFELVTDGVDLIRQLSGCMTLNI